MRLSCLAYGSIGAADTIPPSEHRTLQKPNCGFSSVEKRLFGPLAHRAPEFQIFPEYYIVLNWQLFSEGRWQANAARMIENLADFSHFAWVHPGILGDRAQPLCPEVKLETIDGGFQYEIETPVNRLNPDLTAKQRYVVILPFMLLIQRWQPGSVERHTNIYLCTPMTSKETRFFVCPGAITRDQQPDDLLNQSTDDFAQDKSCRSAAAGRAADGFEA